MPSPRRSSGPRGCAERINGGSLYLRGRMRKFRWDSFLWGKIKTIQKRGNRRNFGLLFATLAPSMSAGLRG